MNTLLPEVLALAKQYAAEKPNMLVEMYTVHDKVEDQLLIWASPSHRDILGYDPQDLVGIPWTKIVDPADHSHKEIMINDTLLTGGSMEIGFNIIDSKGRRRYVKVIDRLYSDPDADERYVICRTTHIEPD